MSFADDLNSVAKTPQQVAAEEKKRDMELGELYAKSDYDSIKNRFKSMAANGQYQTIGGKKYIEFEFENGRFTSLFKVKDAKHIEKRLFGYKETSEISFIPSNNDEFSAYLSALDRLSKEDNVSLKLTGRHQINKGPVQYFSIPGKLVANGYSANTVWTKAVIVCKMSF